MTTATYRSTQWGKRKRCMKKAKRRKIQEYKPSIPNILDSLDTDNSVKEALQYLRRTKISDDDDVHAACVCVICDTFIIGVEPVHWISRDILLKDKSRLSVKCYEEH